MPNTLYPPGSGAFNTTSSVQVLGYDITESWGVPELFTDMPASLCQVIQGIYKTPGNQSNSKTSGNKWRPQDPMMRATFFYILSHSCFSGRMTSFAKKSRIPNISGMEQADYPNVDVSLQSFQETIKQHGQNPDVFMYLDPPYYLYRNYYTCKSRDVFPHQLLCDMLKDCTCQWMLSYNPDPVITEMYKDFNQVLIPTTYCANNGDNQRRNELVIMNYCPRTTGRPHPSAESTFQ